LPIGAIIAWAGDPASVPPGWLVCDGTAKSRSTYARLYAAVTTTYGSGDGTTTFNLPNLSSKHAYGGNATGATGGSTTHDHPFTSTVAIANVASGDHNHNYNYNGGVGAGGQGSHAHNGVTSFASGNASSITGKATGNGVGVQGSAHGHASTAVGGGVAATDSHNHNSNAFAWGNSGNH
jgi:microcystin-dependent protein